LLVGSVSPVQEKGGRKKRKERVSSGGRKKEDPERLHYPIPLNVSFSSRGGGRGRKGGGGERGGMIGTHSAVKGKEEGEKGPF